MAKPVKYIRLMLRDMFPPEYDQMHKMVRVQVEARASYIEGMIEGFLEKNPDIPLNEIEIVETRGDLLEMFPKITIRRMIND